MRNSDDDYFTDDLVFDDRTIALLDEEESKFKRASATSTQTRRSAEPPAEPPAKRQRTTGSWQPQAVSTPLRRTDTLEDMEDLPDVSIQQDGTYGLRDKQRRASGPPTGRPGFVPAPSAITQAGSGSRPVTTTLSQGSTPVVRSTPVTGPLRAAQVPPRPPSSARGPRVVQPLVSSQDVSRSQQGPPQQFSRVPTENVSSNQVEQLLQQIEELRKRNEAIQESVLEAKLAKEGEASILRKRMEKMTQEHLAQIAKAKSAKDESDAKNALLQKQYEADRERWKTEMTFMRHELEAASRKRSVSVLPKVNSSQASTPLPSQRQRSGQWSPAGPSRLNPETPRRPRFGDISDFDRPKKTATQGMREFPSGFQSAPLRSQFVVGPKTPQRMAPVVPNASPVYQGPDDRFPQPDVFGTQMNDEGHVEDSFPHPDVTASDVDMMDEGIPAMTLSQENTTVLTLPIWNLVLHDILVTHTLRGSKMSTLHLLVSVCPTDTIYAQSYASALVRVVETLGGIPAQPDKNFDIFSRVICRALCEIADLLEKNNLIFPLTAVLNLLTDLACGVPLIHALLLPQPARDHDEISRLLEVLYSIIKDQLQDLDLTTGHEPPELHSLGVATLSLYETLVWQVPDESEDSLVACPSMPSLFAQLLCPRRPYWFLIKGVEVLLWLSTRPNLFRALLSHQPGSNEDLGDPTHLPQISLACSLLTDIDRQGPEAEELKSRIIMLIGTLSNAHPDAHMLLVDSQELIPSIVVYLCHLASPIWDENGVIVNDSLAASRTVDTISHTTLLLHHLVIGGDAALDLRERLSCAPEKSFRGLIHSFILTLGRLSYSNPPCWLDVKQKQRLAIVAELAREILERVIQGPELDMIWDTHQDQGEEVNDNDCMDVDDEDAEAQKIADF